MEAGYTEKVDELCDRYSLEGFVKAKGTIIVHFSWLLHLNLLDVSLSLLAAANEIRYPCVILLKEAFFL